MHESDAAQSPPEVSIVVVSYNTREMTLACLASVAAETRTPHEVIVVDNASADGSAAAIRAAHPEVRLLAERTNHGFARAHDVAVPLARAPLVLLLNPDTVVLDGAVDRLLGFARARPEAGIWGGRTVFADGTLNPTSCWGRQTLWSILCAVSGAAALAPGSALLNPEGYGGWARDDEREVDIVTGCFLLIRRDLWDALGGFEPAFFMYGEEADLCFRARRLGARPRFTPAATIVHHGGASERVRADKVVRLARAKTELARRQLPALAAPLLACWPLSRALGYGMASRLPGRAALRRDAATWAEVWRRRGEWRRGFAGGAGP